MILSLFLSFLRIGAFAFGGGYAMVPVLQRELVGLRHWLSPTQFIDVVAISQMTPGPLVINAATLVGFRQAGFWGSAAATLAVVIPSVAIVWFLGLLFGKRDFWAVEALLRGLRPLVPVLIFVAALATARDSLVDVRSVLFAVATILAVGRFRVHPVLVILGFGFLNAVWR